MTEHTTEFVAEFDLTDALRLATEAKDATRLEELFAPLPLSVALRELLAFDADDRRNILTLISPELAASLIEEAPHETGAGLMETLDATRAVEIMDEMDSDVQADLIGDMDDAEAEAILSQMDAADAADVRRLSEYENNTAGGLMMTELFTFRNTQTVGAVLKELAAEENDVDRYRGQHPYIFLTRTTGPSAWCHCAVCCQRRAPNG
ncbi:MAG: hypothetical protein P8P56_14460 [Yoonia sp.]|nr:hypothetical protein [Yoonia sp.]